MRIGARGQVVIPIDVRRAAGLHEGDHVTVTYDGTRIVLMRDEDATTHGQRIVDHLRGRGGTAPETAGMTTDELMALLRD